MVVKKKRSIGWALVLIIFCIIPAKMHEMDVDNKEKDYETIERIEFALDKTIENGSIHTIGNGSVAGINGYVKSFYKSNEIEFCKQFTKYLGEDFSCGLSDGHSIYLEIYPWSEDYKIYIGFEADEKNMIYPDWNYEKLPKPEEDENK